MIAKEIRDDAGMEPGDWLREIAAQLADLNEFFRARGLLLDEQRAEAVKKLNRFF